MRAMAVTTTTLRLRTIRITSCKFTTRCKQTHTWYKNIIYSVNWSINLYICIITQYLQTKTTRNLGPDVQLQYLPSHQFVWITVRICRHIQRQVTTFPWQRWIFYWYGCISGCVKDTKDFILRRQKMNKCFTFCWLFKEVKKNCLQSDGKLLNGR